jgi:hypothetical protein
MFTTLAKSRLANFRLVKLRRIAPWPHHAACSNRPHLNDNLPGFRRPAATGKRRPPTPALACHWVLTGANRLECRWNVRDPALCSDPLQKLIVERSASTHAFGRKLPSLLRTPPPGRMMYCISG